MKTIYQTSATVTGGRNGHVKTDDGILDLEVRMPKEMGGEGKETNPEQLFAAGYAACFDSALNLIMSREKVTPESSTEVTATVSIETNDSGEYELEVKMTAKIPGIENKKAQELIEKAHELCPYSKATRGNIDVELAIK